MKTYPIREELLESNTSYPTRKELVQLVMCGLIVGYRVKTFKDGVLEAVQAFHLYSVALQAFKNWEVGNV